MLLPHLLRAVGPIIYGGFIFLVVSLIFLNFYFPDVKEGFRSHPWRTLLVQAIPWMYPLVCWALFSFAARHDRRLEEDLMVNGIAAIATVTSVRDLAIGKRVFSVVRVDLRVTPPGTEPFDTEVAVDPTESPGGPPSEGMNVRVRYDPHDPSHLVLVE